MKVPLSAKWAGRESSRYAGPLVARSAEEFVRLLDEALARQGESAHMARSAQVALENTCAERARQVLTALAARRSAQG